jgi:hypothetical protein
MIYSCFDPKSGLYDYYEGPDTYPINADLPVPSHLPAEIPGIGVPSIVAARPMPSGLQPAGKGWHARGMLVDCGRTPLGDDSWGMGDAIRSAMFVRMLIFGAVGTAIGVVVARGRRSA